MKKKIFLKSPYWRGGGKVKKYRGRGINCSRTFTSPIYQISFIPSQQFSFATTTSNMTANDEEREPCITSDSMSAHYDAIDGMTICSTPRRNRLQKHRTKEHTFERVRKNI